MQGIKGGTGGARGCKGVQGGAEVQWTHRLEVELRGYGGGVEEVEGVCHPRPGGTSQDSNSIN